ncbi:MAG: hypothetical protein ACKOC9_03175, partial [Alphaproteobacteria bacterium]
MRHLRRLLVLVLAIPLVIAAILGGVLAWVQWGNGAATSSQMLPSSASVMRVARSSRGSVTVSPSISSPGTKRCASRAI